MPKRYYWLQLKENFFKEKEIKKLRKIAGGDTYTIIYLKMLLLAMNQNNKLYFDGIEESFAAELALELDENEENVSVAIEYLKAKNLLEVISEEEFLLTRCAELVTSECDSTARVRRYRERKALQCNNDVTPSNEIVTKCNREIEKDIEIEKDKKSKGDRSPRTKKITPPTVEEIKEYCTQNNYLMDAEVFYDFYSSKDWYVGKNKMKDWKAAVRNWIRRDKTSNQFSKSKKPNSFNNMPTRYDNSDLSDLERQLLQR